MLIEVTQEHIDKGVKKNCQNCPVAIAAQAVLQNSDIRMGQWTLYDSRFTTIARVPFVVTDFVNRFDLGLPVQPFSFNLKI